MLKIHLSRQNNVNVSALQEMQVNINDLLQREGKPLIYRARLQSVSVG